MVRHALPLVLLVALCGPPELSAQDGTNPFTAVVDVGKGRALFDRHCSRCHGVGATGWETGPDLTTGQFRNASTDNGLFSVISRGVDGTQMPAFRRGGDQETWQLVAYLRSLTGGPRVAVPGDPAAGRGVFRGRGDCARCHMVAGEGGVYGPDLSRIGDVRSPDELRSDLLDPDERVLPEWWRMRVRHADGTDVEGRRMDEGTYSVRILDDDAKLWSLRKRDLAASERIESSSMPSYEGRLSDRELQDLIAYLYGLTRIRG